MSEEIVWQALILRPVDIQGMLLDGCPNGDPTSLKFGMSLEEWMNRHYKEQKSSSCLTCDYEFSADHSAPPVFAIAFSDDPKCSHIILSGICERCANEKTDAELLAVARDGIIKWLEASC